MVCPRIVSPGLRKIMESSGRILSSLLLLSTRRLSLSPSFSCSLSLSLFHCNKKKNIPGAGDPFTGSFRFEWVSPDTLYHRLAVWIVDTHSCGASVQVRFLKTKEARLTTNQVRVSLHESRNDPSRHRNFFFFFLNSFIHPLDTLSLTLEKKNKKELPRGRQMTLLKRMNNNRAATHMTKNRIVT